MNKRPGVRLKIILVGLLLLLSACGGGGGASDGVAVGSSSSISSSGPGSASSSSLSSSSSSNSSSGSASSSPDVTPAFFETILSGNLLDEEPDEGAVPASGRTYRGAFKAWNKEEIKGVQFLLGNLTQSEVRGAKMLIGISSNGNPDHLPTNNGVTNNAITGNARTGWVQVKIGGANDLPVRADADGTGLAWTDPVGFSPALQANENVDIVWRIWLPPRSIAKYARTFSVGNDQRSALDNLVWLRREILGVSQWENFGTADYFGRADGDFVTSPSATAAWVNTPKFDGSPVAYFGRDYVSSIPVLGYRFRAARSLPLIEFVGDSITQGYGDGQYFLGSIDGVPGRMLRAMGVGSDARYSIVNFGRSGYTPEEYLARWKGLARADTNGATAMVFSIYSPNGFPHGLTQTGVDRMKQTTLAAEVAAKDLGRVFIPAFITATNYGTDNARLVRGLLDWARARYGDRLLDLHEAIADSASPYGIEMRASMTNDLTHPNQSGYDALGARAVSIFPAVYNNARAAR